MNKVFAKNGKVIETSIVDPFTIFQPAYAAQFIDAPDDVQPGWLYDGTTFTAPPVPPKTPEQLREEAKATRAAAVDAITVTTQAGNTFDGDETAQRRMASAITAMTDADLLPWVLHDNSITMVNKSELIEALRLAGMQMASIWITPYTGQ